MGKSRIRANKKSKSIPQNKADNKAITAGTMDRPETNSRIEYIIIPEFHPNDPRQQISRTPEGSQGYYKVTFVFTIPGKDVFREDLNFVKIMQTGNSLLLVSQNTSYINVSISDGNDNAEILFGCNSSKQISNAQMRIDAPNFVTAERIAYDHIMQQLSFWSYLYDVSIDIAGYEIIEEKTESRKYNFGVVGKFKNFNNLDGFKSVPAYRRFFSAYREGMNSTNAFYQALSFHKVIEGIQAERKREQRRQNGQLAVYANEKLPDNVKDVPIHDELNRHLFQPYLGQSFDLILEKLNTLIRNAIAHLGQLESTLDSDNFDDVNTCLKAIPILRFMAHKMLENDINNISPIIVP